MSRQGAVAEGRYRMSREGQSTQGGLQGMYILKDGAGCQIYRPTWQGTRTVFRPFPGRDPENPGAWDPFRLSDEVRDVGDWIRRYDMAFGFGVPGITFILKNPRDKTIDDQQNPVWMLYRAITQAVKNGTGLPSWNPLIFGQTGKAAPISSPKDGYVMQGILMEHKSKAQTPPRGCVMEHQPVLLLMSQSAGEALLDRLEERDEQGDHRWKDCTNLDGGMFIQFHQAGTQNQPQAGGPKQMGANMALGAAGGGIESNRYEVEFLDLYNGIAPTYPGVHEVARAHVKNWDDIIRIPTIEEQVKMLCGAGIPATAIVYALGDVYGEYIPQHVFDQARAQQAPQTVPFAAAANPMIGGMQTGRNGGSPMGNPMGGMPTHAPAPTAVQQDPGMPTVQQGQPVGGMAAAPAAGNPMGGAVKQAPAADAAVAGFDPQPTHAEGGRSAATKAALEKARARAAAAQK